MSSVTSWTWTCEDADARAVDGPLPQPAAGFPTQADAETWVGESWRPLLAAGVEAVHLLRDGQRVYGPMPLRPAE